MNRLMLGHDQTPILLVEVTKSYSDTHFEFDVVNGAWPGTYQDGLVTVTHTQETHPCEIICRDQNRLRGDYQTVLENFNDPSYVAPPDYFQDELEDDDIPF